MSMVFCCCHPRKGSATSVHDNSSQTGRSASIQSMHVPTSNSSYPQFSVVDDARGLQSIFSTPSSIRGYHAAARSSSQHSTTLDSPKTASLHQKETSGRLSAISNRIRKRLSRESRASQKSVKKAGRIPDTHDPQGLHSPHLQNQPLSAFEDLLASRTVSEGGYDSDAKQIATPPNISEAGAGSIRVSPEYLKMTLRSLEKGDTVVDSFSTPFGTFSEPSRNCATLSGRALIVANDLKDDEDNSTALHGPKRRATSPPTDALRDPIPIVLPLGKNESPLDVIKRVKTDFTKYPARPPPKPELHPLRLASISESLAGNEWRLSFSVPRRISSLRQAESHLRTSTRRWGNAPSDLQTIIDYWRQQLPECLAETRESQNLETQFQEVHIPDSNSAKIGSSEDLPLTEMKHESRSSVPPHFDDAIRTLCNHWSRTCDERDVRSTSKLDALSPPPRTIRADNIDPQTQCTSVNPFLRRSSSWSNNKSDADNSSFHLPNMRISQRLASNSQIPMLSPSISISEPVHEENRSSSGPLAVQSGHRPALSHQLGGDVYDRKRLHPRWNSKAQDDTSSCYISRIDSSVSSLPNSHLRGPSQSEETVAKSSGDSSSFQQFGRRVYKADQSESMLARRPESILHRKITVDTHRSSTDSFRARELVAADLRFCKKISGTNKHRSSRFKEIFEHPISSVASPALSAPDLIELVEGQRNGGATRSTSDGWLSGGRRQGYGYDLVERSQEDAASLWRRAIKAEREVRPRASRRSLGSSLWKRPGETTPIELHIKRSGRSLRPSIKSSRLSIPTPSFLQRERSGSPSFVSSRAKNTAPWFGPKAKRSFPSWARFPRHTRHKRVGPAGATDQVEVHDFSAAESDSTFVGPALSRPGEKGKSTRSTAFSTTGKHWWKNWKQIYRTHSSDLRRSRKGYRSSISKGRVLEFPELEILPGGPGICRDTGVSPEGNDSTLDWTTVRPAGVIRHMDTIRSTEATEEWSPHLNVVESRDGPDSAQAWSRLYEDCVDLPMSSTEANSSLISHQVSPKEEESDHRDVQLHASSPCVSLRTSTEEIRETLIREREQTRGRLMRNARELASSTTAGERKDRPGDH